MRAYTSPVNSYQTQLQEGNLSFPVSDLTATYSRNEIIIFATLKLDNYNSTLNQVWQEGPVSGDSPAMRSATGANVQSMGTLNLLSGQTGKTGGGLKLLHSTCQVSGYIIGVAAWATGLRLGSQSPGVEYTSHRIIGIILFSHRTLQATDMLVRPKRDHKHRFYWNVYHHTNGYSIIDLSIINIFKRFDILNPEEKWKRAYTGILIGLAFAVAILEIFTRCVVLKRKKPDSPQNMPNGGNWDDGYNAYAARTQYRVWKREFQIKLHYLHLFYDVPICNFPT